MHHAAIMISSLKHYVLVHDVLHTHTHTQRGKAHLQDEVPWLHTCPLRNRPLHHHRNAHTIMKHALRHTDGTGLLVSVENSKFKT